MSDCMNDAYYGTNAERRYQDNNRVPTKKIKINKAECLRELKSLQALSTSEHRDTILKQIIKVVREYTAPPKEIY